MSTLRPVRTLPAAVWRLAARGFGLHEIARVLGVEPFRVQQVIQPRAVPDGPCVHCVDAYAKQPVRLHLHHCPHYATTFRFVGRQVQSCAMTHAEFQAEVRAAADRQTAVLPAWNSNGFRAAWARRTLGNRQGPRTLADDFEEILASATETPAGRART